MADQKTESEPKKSAVLTSDKLNDGSDSLDDARSQRVFDSAKLLLLFNASKALASATNLDQLLDIVIGEVQKVIECDGSGVLLYDEVRDDFYWRLVKDEQSFLSSAMDEIRIPRDRGVCGWVFTTGEPALVHDAANDPRIYKEVEQKSGFQTRNMVCTPLQTREKKLGVLYALNKTNGSFTQDDVEILSALASNVALALESASYFERLTNSNLELQRLNRAKDKMLHHLSHELKTPLAIIEASLSIVRRRLEKMGIDSSKLPFERIDRNFDRLRTIEKQLVHIVEGKDYPEKLIIVRFLDHLEEFLEIEQTERPEFQDALESLRRRILTLFPAKLEGTDSTDLAKLLDSERIHTERMKQNRNLDIQFHNPESVHIFMPPQILTSVVRGLVRNAVENTPDHGRIEVRVENRCDELTIIVKDYGIGIPEDEQPNIFEGFYPIKETDLYSSGRPYGFNAGGTGTDLLKIKILSERLGFKIDFKSSRCSCIPTLRDVCPGDITKCSCCDSVRDCLNNGGSEFTIHIPSHLVQQSGSGLTLKT